MDDLTPPCAVFRPDHNGECLNCDDWIDAHTPAAIAAGEVAAVRLAELRRVRELEGHYAPELAAWRKAQS